MCLAPRCRLCLTLLSNLSIRYVCSTFKRQHELGLERRKSVRFLSIGISLNINTLYVRTCIIIFPYTWDITLILHYSINHLTLTLNYTAGRLSMLTSPLGLSQLCWFRLQRASCASYYKCLKWLLLYLYRHLLPIYTPLVLY